MTERKDILDGFSEELEELEELEKTEKTEEGRKFLSKLINDSLDDFDDGINW